MDVAHTLARNVVELRMLGALQARSSLGGRGKVEILGRKGAIFGFGERRRGRFASEVVLLGQNGVVRGSVRSEQAGESEDEAKSGKGNFASVLWKRVVSPLGRFGSGQRSVWEGGVGLFVITGVAMLVVTVMWVKGTQIRAKARKYEAVFSFQQAQGISVGTPVRIRGVEVGSVVQVRPSLDQIDAVVEVSDAGIVVPRNALVEVNQSGLISETLIDVTPRNPLPNPTVDPLDPDCPSEGLIVCDRETIKGQQGVSLDELVAICTKLAYQIDSLGVDRVADMAEQLSVAVHDARPLLLKFQAMASGAEPLLKGARDGGLLRDFEKLTKAAADAGRDLSKLNKEVLVEENTESLRDSVFTLTKTLKHVESISKDVSGVTGDARTRNHLKQLIESLSRLVTD